MVSSALMKSPWLVPFSRPSSIGMASNMPCLWKGSKWLLLLCLHMGRLRPGRRHWPSILLQRPRGMMLISLREFLLLRCNFLFFALPFFFLNWACMYRHSMVSVSSGLLSRMNHLLKLLLYVCRGKSISWFKSQSNAECHQRPRFPLHDQQTKTNGIHNPVSDIHCDAPSRYSPTFLIFYSHKSWC